MKKLKVYTIFRLWRLRLLLQFFGLVVVALTALFISACKPVEKDLACSAVSIVNGFRTIIPMNSTAPVRVPDFARISLTDDCKFARLISIDFLWHEGRLISEGVNRFKYRSEDRIPVSVIIDSFRLRMGSIDDTEHWRFDSPLQHVKYPLEMYPRAYWKDAKTKPLVAPPDTLWGVRGTKNPISHRPYIVACSINRADKTQPESVTKGEFAKVGDSKCRGAVIAVKGDYILGAMVDVWANGAPEVDSIFNAVEKELETYIQGE